MEYPTQSRRKTKHKIKPVFVLHIGKLVRGYRKKQREIKYFYLIPSLMLLSCIGAFSGAGSETQLEMPSGLHNR